MTGMVIVVVMVIVMVMELVHKHEISDRRVDAVSRDDDSLTGNSSRIGEAVPKTNRCRLSCCPHCLERRRIHCQPNGDRNNYVTAVDKSIRLCLF